MNVEDLFQYLGDSEFNDEFDDAMAGLNIIARPRGEDPTVFLYNPEKNICLAFENRISFLERRVIAPKSTSEYLLAFIDVKVMNSISRISFIGRCLPEK